MVARFVLVNVFLFTLISGCQERPFVIIVKSNNCINDVWKKTTVASIFGQKYQNFRVIYLCSENATHELVEKFILENQIQNRVAFIENTGLDEAAIADCLKHESIVIRDEDDWLPHENYLRELNKQASHLGASAIISCENFAYLASLTVRKL